MIYNVKKDNAWLQYISLVQLLYKAREEHECECYSEQEYFMKFE